MRFLRPLPFLFLFPACSADVEDPDGHPDHDHGLITDVDVVFTPVGGGEASTFSWSEDAGGGDPIVLDAGSYDLELRLFNDLHDPIEEVTAEVEAEAEEHQFFLTGPGVSSEATGANPDALLQIAYADADADGLPLGLAYDATTLQAGSSSLTLTLRHLPPEDGSPTKTAGLADDVATGGFGAIGGDTDLSIEFDLTVQ
jgi:hypothetical protein